MQKNQIQYLECDKAGYHYGQALNMICLQQSCLDKALCCGACIEQSHKNHKTKPLKLVLIEARETATTLKPITIDTTTILKQLNDGKKDVLARVGTFKDKINQSINSIQKSINNWYSSVADQIIVKTSGLGQGADQLFDSVYKQSTIPSLLGAIQKIIALLPKPDASKTQIKQNEVIQSIKKINGQIDDCLTKIVNEYIPKLNTESQTFNSAIIQKDIWANVNFKFSQKFKHNEVAVLNATTIKSGNIQAYKFSLLEPYFKKNVGTHKIGFKIKQSTASNWLAFGVCHKNVVSEKNYSFTFNNIGHGGYLVSSNGGIWSHIDPLCNNHVKAFKFTKGDIIGVFVDYETNKVKFKKKGGNQSYELAFVNKPEDPLYPCVLLYYPNDEVEIIQNYSHE